MLSTYEIGKRITFLQTRLTELCLAGTDLVPNATDKPAITAIADEIFSLSQGFCEIRYDKLGRPSVMFNIFNDEQTRLDYLSEGGTLFSDSEYGDTGRSYLPNVHPAMIVDDAPIRVRRIGLYPDCKVNGKNYHVSLFGLPPAYGGGGFTESYNGIIAECDRINAGTADGDYVDSISVADFALIGLLSARKGFCTRGNDNQGKSCEVSTEKGNPCGYNYNGHFVHVLNGSGPNSWRHNGTPFGIWGLRGNVFALCLGYQMDKGRLLYTPNNNHASMARTLSLASGLAETSTSYKALLQTGVFTARDSTDPCMTYDFTVSGAADYAAYEIATDITNFQESKYGSLALKNLGVRTGVTIPLYMRLMLDAPLLANTPNGNHNTYFSTTRRVAPRGGGWRDTSTAGFGCAVEGWSFGDSNNGATGRVASYE